ncbi:MAG: hypothetical protein GY803_19320, partial [Chloroflexi bacterium]|nr:hypothetical protein [Chloroflexota bacterium]
MNMSVGQEGMRERKRNRMWLLFLLALLLNFVCIFSSVWLAGLLQATDSVSIGMLANGKADYGVSDEPIQFSPLDAAVIEEAATDADNLRRTPTPQATQDDRVPLTPTPTAVAASPTPTASPTGTKPGSGLETPTDTETPIGTETLTMTPTRSNPPPATSTSTMVP